MPITSIDGLKNTAPIGPSEETGSVCRAAAVSASLPDAAVSILDSISLPTLPPTCGGLSLENMMEALGNTARRNAVRGSVDDLESKGKEQEEINKKELNEIKERLEKMKSKSVLNGFLKAFNIIGLIVGAVAAVATTVAGVLTSNPLLVTAGIVGIAMTADNLLSMATDGKVSLMAGCTALGKAIFKGDEEKAKIFGMVMYGVIMVAAIATTVTVGVTTSASAAANAAKHSAEVAKIAASVSKITNIAGGVNSIATGGVTIGGAVVDSSISKSQARSKQLQAALEKVRQAIQFNEDIIKAEMERTEELMDGVMDIVENCANAQKAIVTANPGMA